MKWMIASDLHGSAYFCRRLLSRFEQEGAHRLLLLGDLLYHGPRNALPPDYDPKKTAELLNQVFGQILCVRGNCDSEVDQMMLKFPILAEYAVLDIGDRMIFATHGHYWNENDLPPIAPGSILLNGHTHLPACREHDGFLYLNPGSAAMPKGDSTPGYMILEGRQLMRKDLEGNVQLAYRL